MWLGSKHSCHSRRTVCEPCFRLPSFSAKPRSASAEFVGNLDELGSGADDGAVLSIPAAMGAVTFENVQSSYLEALLTWGVVPELVGTVMVVMESDFTPWGTINNLMEDVESALQTELVNQVEPLTIAQLTNPEAIADALESLFDDVPRMRELGVNGRARVEGRYSWDRIASDTARSYRATIARARSEARDAVLIEGTR